MTLIKENFQVYGYLYINSNFIVIWSKWDLYRYTLKKCVRLKLNIPIINYYTQLFLIFFLY